MEILVASKKLLAGMTTAFDVSGREHLVIVIKASWSLPQVGGRPRPVEPSPLTESDEFYGEPGESAMRYGGDFVRFKPRCDVLFDAHAYAPDAQPVTELLAGFKLGTLQKGIRVTGPRKWVKRFGIATLTAPEAFTKMPLHYGFAFGGSLPYQKGSGDQAQMLTDSLLSNPAGTGWAGSKTGHCVDGMPAPCLEALDTPVTSPAGKYRPVALSAVARHWSQRNRYAGTYDAHWEREICPFLPEDFDEQYHQCAPEDQQIPYPKGGEEVVLINMVAGREQVRFRLPRLDHMQVRILRKDYSTEAPEAVVDTLFFEPDAQRFSAIWRVSVPIRRRVQEFNTIAIGPVNAEWWQNKILGLSEEGCATCGGGPEVLQHEELPE